MNKTILYAGVLVAVCVIACNDAENGHDGHGNDSPPRTLVDSLRESVDDDHIAGMAKMGKLTRAEQTTLRLLDSIGKLPVKSRQAAQPLINSLESLQKDLSYAESAMNKWMVEYKQDSLKYDVEASINYLSSEKLKITKVKEAILSSLQKADSLIKGKF